MALIVGVHPAEGGTPVVYVPYFITFGVWCEWMFGARVEKVKLGDSVHCLPQMVWSWWILNISRKGEVSCVPLPHSMLGGILCSLVTSWLLPVHPIDSVLT